ncbi:MAG: M23 family metallopeptidase [Bacteroidales bacterium]|nr:M23 family metallopeptidase [Bacteroidales bacterium]
MSDKKTKAPRKIRIIIDEDETHKTLWKTATTTRWLGLMAAGLFLLLAVIFWFIVAFTPIKTLIPGYPDARSRQAAVENALRIDTLEMAVSRWALYAGDLRRALEGEPSMGIDSIIRISSRPVPKDVRAKDSLLRRQVAQEEQFALSSRKDAGGLEGMHFFTPLKGVVSFRFDRITHPYIDVTAPDGSPVKAVLDGTVVFNDYSEYDGYSLIIQHDGGVISVYHHCDRLLCKTGDRVAAGTAIAFLGSVPGHLHFALWHGGEPVDPELYIKF